MKRTLYLLSLLVFCVTGRSQNVTPTFTQPIGATFGNMTVIRMLYAPSPAYGYGQAMVYLPPGYNDPANATQKYPLYVFSPGSGETTQNNIIEVQKTSLPQLISQGFRPYSIDTITHDTIDWIVIVQHNSLGAAYAYPQLQYTIPYLLADTIFRIDNNCVWFGGLSNGARASVSVYVGNNVGDTALGKTITGIMVISGAGYDNFQNSTGFANIRAIMKSGGKAFAVIGDQDQNFNQTGYKQFDTMYYNAAVPPGFRGAYRHYVFAGAGHTNAVWNPCFQLNFKGLDSTQNKWNAWDLMWSMRKNAPITTLSANAGTNQTITLPTTITTLSGSATTPAGTTITTYAWSRISGPNTPTISSPNAASTNVTGMIQGSYVFRLTVTNSASATAFDDVNVDVIPAAANPPIVSAGGAQAIQLPTTITNLNGSAVPQGSNTITSIQWTQTSGPVTGSISSPNAVATTITGLSAVGTYVFRLTATDNLSQTASSNVNVVVNPAATATNVVIKPILTEYAAAFLYKDSLVRKFVYNQTTGHVQFDPFVMNSRKAIDGAPLFNRFIILDDQRYMWITPTSGSTCVRIDTDTLGNPMNDVQSVYGYFYTGACIRADGSIWMFGQDDYHFFTSSGTTFTRPIKLNTPPGVQFKFLAMGLDLIGITTTGLAYKWSLGSISYALIPLPGPALTAGASHYPFNIIIVDDGAGSGMGYPYAYGSESAFWGGNGSTVVYNAPVALKTLWNMTVPIKSLAVNKNTIHYVDSLGRLFGIGDNPNGEIGNGQELVNHSERYPTPYAWSWVKYELMTGAPPIHILPGTVFKSVWGGAAFVFYNYALDASDGLYFWGRNKSFCGGDGVANSQEATYPNALDVLIPSLRDPLAVLPTQTQYYNFTLPTAKINTTDTISTNSNAVTLTVAATPPTLVASGKPNYGYTITGYQWSKISGPAATFTAPTSTTTDATGLSTGTYKFGVLVTGSNTGTWADTITVLVNNSLPIVSAGPDQTITLPATPTLVGSASGQGGNSIIAHSWSVVSGPSTPTITAPGSYTTTVTALIAGVYKFRLTATDNLSNVNTSDVIITVNGAASNNCQCLITPLPAATKNVP